MSQRNLTKTSQNPAKNSEAYLMRSKLSRCVQACTQTFWKACLRNERFSEKNFANILPNGEIVPQNYFYTVPLKRVMIDISVFM